MEGGNFMYMIKITGVLAVMIGLWDCLIHGKDDGSKIIVFR